MPCFGTCCFARSDDGIAYIVTDVAPFRRNLDWIQRFGERVTLQMPDEMDDLPFALGSWQSNLLRFLPLHRRSKCSGQANGCLVDDRRQRVHRPTSVDYAPKLKCTRIFFASMGAVGWPSTATA